MAKMRSMEQLEMLVRSARGADPETPWAVAQELVREFAHDPSYTIRIWAESHNDMAVLHHIRIDGPQVRVRVTRNLYGDETEGEIRVGRVRAADIMGVWHIWEGGRDPFSWGEARHA